MTAKGEDILPLIAWLADPDMDPEAGRPVRRVSHLLLCTNTQNSFPFGLRHVAGLFLPVLQIRIEQSDAVAEIVLVHHAFPVLEEK